MFLFEGLPYYLKSRSLEYDLSKMKFIVDTENVLRTTVAGTRLYTVVLTKSGTEIEAICSCPYYDHALECKHIVAVANNLGTTYFGSMLSRNITYYFKNDVESLEDDIDLEDDEPYDYKPRSIVTTSKLISDLKFNFKRGLTKDDFFNRKDAARELIEEVWYELTFSTYYSEEASVQLFTRSRLKNGGLGKIKNRSLELKDISDLARKDDQSILQGIAPFAEFHQSTGISVCHIPADHRNLLIQIIKSGRSFTDKFNGGEREPFTWNETPLVVQLHVDSTKRVIELITILSGKPVRGVVLLKKFLLGILSHHVHPIVSFLDVKLLDGLSPLLGKKLGQSDWGQLSKFILTNFDHRSIGGDGFGLPIKIVTPQLKVYLKIEAHQIQGFFETEVDRNQSALHVQDEQWINWFNRVILELQIALDHENCFLLGRECLIDFIFACEKNGLEVFAQTGKVKASKNVNINVTSGINWFEAEFDTADSAFSSSHLIQAARAKSQYVELANGTIHFISPDVLEKVDKLLKHGDVKSGKIILSSTRALVLDEMISKSSKIDNGYIEFVKRIKAFESIGEEKCGTDFTGELRPYQRLSLGWFSFLENMKMGGCLADDMGLGKTVQVIAHLERRITSGQAKGMSLIICPKSLTFNWKNEFAKFSPHIKTHVFTGGEWREEFQNSNVIIMTYSLMQRNVETLLAYEFDYIVLDEAQNIKNSSSLTAKSAYTLKGSHRLALTGTPVENHLGELMSIFNFLNPGSFKRSLTTGGGDLGVKDLSFIKPFMLRRKKEDVLKELPSKSVQVIFCEQTKLEKKHYEKLKSHIHHEIHSKIKNDSTLGKDTILILEALTRLRQASCHLGLLDKKLETDESGKFMVLKEMIEEIIAENHKVIIFSQFTSLLKLARRHLTMDESNSCYLDGKTKNREAEVQRFKSGDELKCFFVSLKAGGVGLNLTEASYCFLLDPWWNPAAEAQAIDRIHRIGQKRPVNAYRLIMKGTIEEKVLQLQERKKNLVSEVLEGNEEFIKHLSRDDIEYLVGV
jgi:superfamily II DNA or RNA helicase